MGNSELLQSARQAALNGQHERVIRTCTEALARPGLDPGTEIEFLDLQAESWTAIGDLASATQDSARMVRIARQSLQPDLLARAYLRKAETCEIQGDRPGQFSCARKALRAARKSAQPRLTADCLLQLGASQENLGNYRSAIQIHQQAIDAYHSLGEIAQEGRAYRLLAWSHFRLGKRDECRQAAEKALALAQQADDNYGIGNALLALISTDIDLADVNRRLSQARRAFETAGYLERLGVVLDYAANVAAMLGFYPKARRNYQAAIDLYHQAGIQHQLDFFLASLALMELKLGNTPAARACLVEMEQIRHSKSYPWLENKLATYEGIAALQEGDPAAALQHLNQALEISRAARLPAEMAALVFLSQAYLADQKPGPALEATAQAVELFQRQGGVSLMSMGDIDSQQLWRQHSLALSANYQPQEALEALEKAYLALVEPIANWSDAGLRRNYLNKVALHRQILLTWMAEGERLGLPEERTTLHLAGEASLSEPFQRLADISLRMNALRTLSELVEFLIGETLELIGAERALLILDAPSGWELAGARLPDGEVPEQHFLELEDSLKRAFSVRSSLLLYAPPGAPRIEQRSRIIAPLIAQNRMLGFLYADLDGRFGRLEDSDHDLLGMLANQAAVAIDNVHWAADLEQKVQARTDELIQSNKIQTALFKITEAANTAQDIQEFYRQIHQIISELMYAENIFIALYDETSGLLSFPYFVDEKDEPFPTQPLENFHGMTSYVIRSGEMIRHGWDQFNELVDSQEVALEGSYNEDGIGAPLKANGKTIGAIFVQSYTRGIHYTNKDDEVLAFVAQHIATALTRLRALESERQRGAELAILNSISEAMSRTLDVKSMTQVVGNKLREIFDAESVTILLLDPQTNLIHALYEYDKGEGGIITDQVEPFPFGTGLTSQVISTRQPLLLGTLEELIAHGSYFPPELLEKSATGTSQSYLGVPILASGQALGVVSLGDYHPHAFNQNHLHLLQTISASMGASIENARLYQAEQNRVAELALINSVSEAMASQLDEETIIRTVGEKVLGIFQTEVVTILLYDPQTEMIRMVYSYDRGLRSSYPPAWRLGHGLTSRVITSRQRVLLGTAEECAQAGSFINPAAGQGEEVTQSYLGIPIFAGDQVIGVISVQSYTKYAYDALSASLLTTLASNMGVALQNARLFVDADRRAGQMAILAEAGREISASRDLDGIMKNIAQRAHEVCRARTTVLRLLEPEQQVYRTMIALGMYAEQFSADSITPGKGITGSIIQSGIPEIIPDTASDPRVIHVWGTPDLEEQPETMMVAPLVVRNQTVGVLNLYRWTAAGQFTPFDLDFLSGLARQAAISIENARLFAEVQRQKEFSELLLEYSPVAIVTGDRRFVVSSWNQGAERLFGYTADEAIGRHINDLVANLPELHEEAAAYDDLNLSGGSIHAITRRCRKDGSLVDVEISGTMVVVNGEPSGHITIYHDLSELKRAEAALSKAKAEAEAANEAKSAFLAMMSHEIRTPMNAIIGMSGLLLDTPLNEEQRDFAETVRNSGDALLTIINDILDFSKIEAGKMDLEQQPFDLCDCVESALDLMKLKAAEKGLELAAEISPDLPATIMGDVTRLRQILVNLLSNALKFTEQGEVILSAALADEQPGSPQRVIHFSVRDTGIGIPADRLHRLFQAFSQVDASTARKYGGTGLGLAVSKRLTEMMGGQMWVESAGIPGKGSTFYFTIQAQPAELGSARSLARGEQPELRGRRLLIVDDNLTSQRILTLQTQGWGMLPRATGSPVAALAWLRQDEPFDLAILDLHMPEMDGISLAQELRKLRSAEQLPLVLLSSLGGYGNELRLGLFAATLIKPVRAAALLEVVQGILTTHALQPAAAPARPALDAEMATRCPLRILLAEDNAVNQKLALRLLSQMGYRADVAANGLEAIQAVERQVYDLILMDVQMPEMDGLEATRRIRASTRALSQPMIIAMTANAMQGDREACLEAGMDDYVSKPIRVEELVAALARAAQGEKL